jgi:hypothetical protein
VSSLTSPHVTRLGMQGPCRGFWTGTSKKQSVS